MARERTRRLRWLPRPQQRHPLPDAGAAPAEAGPRPFLLDQVSSQELMRLAAQRPERQVRQPAESLAPAAASAESRRSGIFSLFKKKPLSVFYLSLGALTAASLSFGTVSSLTSDGGASGSDVLRLSVMGSASLSVLWQGLAIIPADPRRAGLLAATKGKLLPFAFLVLGAMTSAGLGFGAISSLTDEGGVSGADVLLLTLMVLVAFALAGQAIAVIRSLPGSRWIAARIRSLLQISARFVRGRPSAAPSPLVLMPLLLAQISSQQLMRLAPESLGKSSPLALTASKGRQAAQSGSWLALIVAVTALAAFIAVALAISVGRSLVGGSGVGVGVVLQLAFMITAATGVAALGRMAMASLKDKRLRRGRRRLLQRLLQYLLQLLRRGRSASRRLDSAAAGGGVASHIALMTGAALLVAGLGFAPALAGGAHNGNGDAAALSAPSPEEALGVVATATPRPRQPSRESTRPERESTPTPTQRASSRTGETRASTPTPILRLTPAATPVLRRTPAPTRAPGVAAPVVNSLGCRPTTVQIGQTVACSPFISGAVGSWSWAAPGASPSAGSEATLSFSYSTPGTKTITFTACNGSACSTESQTVSVGASVPTTLPQTDSDGDGIFDSSDSCPSQPEDRDGFQDGDGCPDPDNDGDGILDNADGCPNQAESYNGYQDADGCPDVLTQPSDSDGDGILDSADACPNQAESYNGYQDTDGCPDVAPQPSDSDGDGILDNADACPAQAEDFDGFQDADGCPDPDNDGDGLPDTKDNCPNQPEDKDGFEDADGCPDPDNDEDGIPDTKDKCPNQAENYNGFQDSDGCPDSPPIP